MRYVNTKTGSVIDVSAPITGGPWKPVPEKAQASQPPKKTKPKK